MVIKTKSGNKIKKYSCSDERIKYLKSLALTSDW